MKDSTKYIILLLIMNYSLVIKSQDFHLSQYDMTIQYLNPALTGIIIDDYKSNYRVNATYRNQWSALNGDPFTTMILGYDMSYNRFGIGGFLYSNRAGNGNLNTFNFLLSGSYQILNNTTDHSLSVGLQIGFLNKSIDPNKFLFDSQYSASSGGLDANIPSGEALSRNTIWNFDSNIGIFYRNNDKNKRANPYAGLSFTHITQPNESFYNNNKLPARFTFHGGSEIKIDDEISINPNLLYMQQAKASELYVGLISNYKIKDTDYTAIAGFAWRNQDAIIIHLGIKQKANTFRISYDFNTSSLSNYTRGIGALEFGLVYSGKMNLQKSNTPQYK